MNLSWNGVILALSVMYGSTIYTITFKSDKYSIGGIGYELHIMAA